MSTLNKRCPCGSGKKFKNCCAKQDRQQTHRELITEKHNNASTFYDAGNMDSAHLVYEEILKLVPRDKTALFKLSLIATHQRDYARSAALLRKVIELDPKNPVYYSNLGFVLHEDNRPDEAISVLNKSIALNPNQVDAYLNRANSFTVQGKNDKAISDYRSALNIAPRNSRARANMAYTMNFSPSISESELFKAHREYAYSIETKAPTSHNNDPTPDRKLKIGYLSSEFRQHSVSYFIEHVLEHHNKNQFEIYAYYNHEIIDDVTKNLIEVCDHWCNISRLSDQAVIHKIRQDGIDILIDLMGYTSNNRLKVLASKPAPLQCEWLGYPNTTGLNTMDYWICDEITNPPGLTDEYYSESLLYLHDCFICFKPPASAPDPGEAARTRNGYITFGSFNNYAKVSDTLLQLWAEILNAIPSSHLLLKSACLGHPSQRQLVTNFFSSRNIEPGRIQLEGYDPSRSGHLEKYTRMDIALDTFPYNGTTTTCEALWMGVPTITLSGKNHRSRVGKTLLENAGLGELVADSEENYIAIASELANDPDRLSKYHDNLRTILSNSTITDSIKFTASLEVAYKKIWKKWCEKKQKA